VVTQDFENKIKQAVDWPWKNCPCPTVVFVGRLARVKRLDLLIHAFAISKQSTHANLLIIGDGPEAGNAKALAYDLALGESCKFLGHQDNPLPWIRQSDLLVLCSDAEGFGLVLVEAMACGTQVLSTNCPDGPAELLAHGKYGRLVPMGDASALAYAIEESLKNPVASEIMLKARAAEFDAANAVMQYVNLFKDVQGK
jgi:glycosyltransferase involved in cell wall biosynthesis